MANNKHLMTGPERKQLILIPENLNISRGEAERNIENFFDLLYSWKFWSRKFI